MYPENWLFGRKRADPVGARTLIVGAGNAGRTLARDLAGSPDFGLLPCGFLDDDVRKRRVDRLSVLGPISSLSAAVRAQGIGVVIVAIPSLPPIELAGLLQAAARSGAQVRYLPSFHAAVKRDTRADDLYAVSPASLLGRDEVQVVRSATPATVRGRRVLVTGAGGSIGAELCRQIGSYGPAALYMLDHDESNLHRLQLEVSGEALLDTDELIVADIRDEARIRQVFATFRPQVVYHAAAHKHLPLLERHPCEGVKSNVLGTQHVIDAAVEFGRKELAGVRSGGDAARMLTFDSADMTVEIAVERGRIIGQLVPPQPGTVEVRYAGGSITIEADAIGRFACDAVPRGPFSLRCVGSSATPIVTDWIVL